MEKFKMPSKQKSDNIDSVLERLGPFRRYHLTQICIIYFGVWNIAFPVLSIVFTGQANPYRCPNAIRNQTYYSSNESLFYEPASSQDTEHVYDSKCASTRFQSAIDNRSILLHNSTERYCDAFDVEFSLPKNSFFVSEFNLVCEREYLVGLTQTVMVLGHLLGTLVFPYPTDRFGRKPTLVFSAVCMLLSSIGLTFSVNYEMYIVFKLLVGIFVQGLECAVVNANIELPADRYRILWFSFLGIINWSCACTMLAPIAYLLRHYSWRVLEFTLAVFNLILAMSTFFLDESIRWMHANGRQDNLMRTLRRAAKMNRVDFGDVKATLFDNESPHLDNLNNGEANTSKWKMVTDVEHSHSNTDACVSGDSEHLTIKHLFSDPMLRKHVVFGIVAWFFNSLIYYALFLMSASLHGSIFISYALNAVVEIPPGVYVYVYRDTVGRRQIFSRFSVLAGVSLIAVGLVHQFAPEQTAAITSLSIIGKMAISGSFGILYVFTTELFPTNLRNSGPGFAYLSARIGSMMSPFTGLLMREFVSAPGLVFGASSLLLALTPYVLPETSRYPLPQTLAEMKLWGKPITNSSDTTKTNTFKSAYGDEPMKSLVENGER